MKKNYTIKFRLVLSILFVLLICAVSFSQSKIGKRSPNIDFSQNRSIQNISTNRPGTPVTQATTTVTACGSYTWPVNGATYNLSGVYTSGGGITQQFNDQTAWNNSAATYGATVAFNNMAGITAATVINLTIGTTNVTITAPNGVYSNGTFLGTNNAQEPLTISFNPPIYGVSGNFFNTNVSDNVVNGNLTATYSDGAADTRNVNSDTETFGYFSTTPLTSVVLSTTSTNRFVSFKNLSIATNPAADDTLNLTVIPIVTPTFTGVPAICSGATLAPLPTTSNNGITGTWTPALNNTSSTTYTFTPATGQCATTATMGITVFPLGANTTNKSACNSYTWPITGITYTTSGAYTTTIPLTDTVEIDNLNTWSQHAFSFNSTVNIADVSTIPATNPTVFTMGSTTITLSAPGGMYSGGDFLGTANPNNPITITFNPPVYGVSANYFTTDINDNIIPGNVTVTYSDGHVQSRTVSTDTDTFGYFDNTFISSVVLSTSTTVPNHYVSLKNLAIAANPTSCSTETLNLTINTLPPPGDTIATAIEVNTPNYSTTGNNLSSNCYTDTIGELSPDVWYKVNLNACAQTMSLNTCTGSNFDTILTVYAQDGVTELGYSDDDCGSTRQSSITDLDVSGEDVVYVMVEGYYGLGEEEGTYGLNITQTLLPQTAPTFQAVAGICRGDSLAPLPTTSDNGITGTWSPALDNTVTTTYTFTPDATQCASQTTLIINVTQPTVPTFNAVAPICNGDALSALPTTSNNGYTGTWSPALDNTVTTTYTFTPTPGQCAAQTTLTITVNQPVTPTFTAVAPICNGDTLAALPTTSNNGYTGAWSPAINNTATTTYTFTPTAGQCAASTTMTIVVNQPVTPTFMQVAPICNGDIFSLPTTSNNGYNGTWFPAINNTATTTYTFTPIAGQCATTASMTVTVNQPVTPTFIAVAPICNGDTLAALPATSNNGYTGTWSPSLNNTTTTTYTFTPDAGQCATTATLTIVVNQPITPTFTAVAPICNGDALTALPTTSNNGYTGTWSPALNNTVTTTYTFTPTAGQCAASTTLTIIVNQPITPTFTAVAPICNGDTLSLPTTSNNGYTGNWSPALNNTATTTYTFTPDGGQCATTASMTVTVNQPITPTFTAVAPICNGDTLAALPTTSNNGYTGTWSPALNNTVTTTYTFTPTAGQCATTATLTITVNQPITPTFTAVAPICNGDTLVALPTTSNNGYTGSWSPALNNTATTTYTFTPDAGQCASTASLTITVNQPVIPTFTAVAPICNGDSLAALPTTSNNGYTGSWSPALDNTATTTYTFTPTPGQCATTATLTITVNQPVTPTFTALSPICNGDAFVLPTNSNNGYTGSWSPALDNTATTTYTFTPSAGQCATSASMTVTVNQPVTPIFTAVAPICSGDIFSLPSTSNNGYTGNWSPALNNTATTTYTFTPDGGQCATTASMTVTVNQPITPTFTAVAPICNGDTLAALPTTSDNSYTGTWSPAINNVATTTYTFTPDAGQCATSATLTITVNQPVTPTFTTVAPICNGDTLVALPTTSNNGYTGSWSPVLENTATTTYTFTPDAGQCASTATLTITVNQPVIPTFTPVAPICSGGTLAPLPTTSNDGITGSWSPVIDNTATTTYTFTPDAGQCAAQTTLTITVNQPTIVPSFTAITPICSEGSFTLPPISNNGITGTWFPAIDNTTTTTYTFTPDAGQCGIVTTITVVVNQPVTPTFNALAPICNGDVSPLPSTSNNGISGVWSPAFDNTASGIYSFTPNAGQCATTTTLSVTVNQPITPTFTAVAPICNGDPLAALPTTSDNSYTGTWSPAINNVATTTYTFTPDAGQCATSATLTITVNQPVTPTFTAVAPICNGDTLVALPTTSNNGYIGSWSPVLDNTATTTYTFTPDAGQCASTATLTITVNQPVIPTFTPVAPICSGGTLVSLPTTSNNGVTGSWSPALDNTATTTYTFTPDAGQCATQTTLTITVNQPTIVPSFTAITPICNGGSFTLPSTSNNGITGTWFPAIDNTTTTTYTFTPDAGQCGIVTTITVVVNQPVTPTFNALASICNGDASPLPLTSNNGISGTWSPAFDNTASGIYSFTPNAGQCATTTTLSVTVNQPITPTFTAVAPICNGDALAALPTTSDNGYTGTWSPAINNVATTTYTFTPDAGQCATSATLTITVNQPVTPTFTAVAPICNGDALAALPTTSNNGYTGSWSPVLDNTATTTYTFTPDAGQCASTATLTITVNQPVIPTFTPVAPICSGGTLALLPTTSNNGVTGSWSPALDNTATTTYTFTPDAGQCAASTSLTITINQPVSPSFGAISAICSGGASPLPVTSNNGVSGTWSPAFNNTASGTYTFTPTAGQCAVATTLSVTVIQPTIPTFTPVAAICNGDPLVALPTTSNNGYTGSWLPALNNTATTTYTFTPDPGQCAATTTMTIVVNTTPTPTGSSTQVFDVINLNDATIANLVVNPSDVYWYASLADALSLSNPLPSTTVLTNGSTYYAVAMSTTCPSQPFAVLVTVSLSNSGFDDLHLIYYPNPTSSVITISYDKEITELTLMNMLGQIIAVEKTNTTEVKMDLSRLAEATYFIKIVADDKEKIIKVVKQR